MELNRFFVIRLSNGTTTYTIDGSTPGLGITAGSMNLEEVLCDGELEIGAAYANKFEAQLYGLNHDVTGYTITVYNNYDPSNRQYIFTGKIDSSKTDNKNGYRDIIAYDKMYEVRDIDVGPWWTSFWQNRTTASLKTIRESMCSYVGLTSPTVILPNDSMSFSKPGTGTDYDAPALTSVKFNVLLRMICELQMCCPNISRRGALEFIQLGQNNPTVQSVDTEYDKNSAEFEDFITAQPTGFSVYSSSSDLSQIVPSDPSINTNPYPISGNVFLLSVSASTAATTLSNLVSYVSRLQYMPATIPMIVSKIGAGSTDTTLGTIISTVQRGSDVNHIILAQTFSGAQLVDQTINSPAYGEYFNNTGSSRNDSIVAGMKSSKFEQDIDGLHAAVFDATTGQAKVDILAEEVRTEINDINGNMTVISETIDGITVTGASGTTLVAGDKIETDTLRIHQIWARASQNTSYAEMLQNGLNLHLGINGSIHFGYTEAQNSLPYLRVGVASSPGGNTVPAILKKYEQVTESGKIVQHSGVWIGDDKDLNDTVISRGTGLFIDFKDNVLYKVIRGEFHEILDSQTSIARFG